MSFLLSAPGEAPALKGLFPVSVERAWRAWTVAEEFAAWFGIYDGRKGRATLDARLGGAWRFDFQTRGETRLRFEGTYVRVEPNRALSFTWCHVETTDGTESRTPVSTVHVTFAADPKGTRLSLLHEGLAGDALLRVGAGWGAAFENLSAYLGGGEGSSPEP